jgi:hypothetical protein
MNLRPFRSAALLCLLALAGYGLAPVAPPPAWTQAAHTYGHMWPDKDESARAAVSEVLAARTDYRADCLRTDAAAAP